MTTIKVALIGNPNTGKSTVFNLLTGLNQKIGNFPGITVDKKTGHCALNHEKSAQIIDLPGTYSLYAKSKDESIVFEVLTNPQNPSYPDVVVIVADATNLKRNLLLCAQVADLGLPMLLALNMCDLAKKEGIYVETDELAKQLGIQVVAMSARKGEGLSSLKQAIALTTTATQTTGLACKTLAPEAIEKVKTLLAIENDYYALQILHQHPHLLHLNLQEQAGIKNIIKEHAFASAQLQVQETEARYHHLNTQLNAILKIEGEGRKFKTTDKIDAILTHKVWGFVVFLAILLFVFDAIFSWSSLPMEWIEQSFAWLTTYGHQLLPAGVLTDLLLDGVVAGLGGIVIFIPQIAILFALISILEDTGYMARVTFMLDKVMRKVGLSGKSVVPMIGGIACAVPSIMSTRTIENWKDRIITIMITPLVSCSARLPVYTLLISLIIPEEKIFGFLSLQGIALMCMYLISLIAAVLVAFILKFIIKAKERAYFILEMPVYRMPRWKNVGLTMYEKSKTFVLEAGKVIIAISIVLWVLATYGPSKRFAAIDQKYAKIEASITDSTQLASLERDKSAERLENSYAGILGQSLEPVIKPLGYDWKIGIALITSFAAREAFVGTVSTIYSVDAGQENAETRLLDKIRQAKDPLTGFPIFTFATGLSLMLFYAFAMQCMSTVAIVYRETKSWKWPVIQLLYMTGMAYISALIAYQLLK